MNELEKLERAKLNTETATISWKEIEPYFAKGMVIYVAENLDLIDVAFQISRDKTSRVQQWIDKGEILREFDELAARWSEEDTVVWCVVVKPWVLVQESHINAH